MKIILQKKNKCSCWTSKSGARNKSTIDLECISKASYTYYSLPLHEKPQVDLFCSSPIILSIFYSTNHTVLRYFKTFLIKT